MLKLILTCGLYPQEGISSFSRIEYSKLNTELYNRVLLKKLFLL